MEEIKEAHCLFANGSERFFLAFIASDHDVVLKQKEGQRLRNNLAPIHKKNL